jgi:hypothetical protein
MTTFADLPKSPALPASPDGSMTAAQQAIDAIFPAVVANSPLRLWRPGDPIPGTGDRLLIGIATWSARDLSLLDTLSAAVAQQNTGLLIDVFNVADCPSQAAFDRYIPGVGPVFHTPVVGFWSGGRLLEKASGKAGRDLAARVVGLHATDSQP